MLSPDVHYVGVNDHDIDLFEGQYFVPDGMSYNAYAILDEKVAVLDTVDIRKQAEYLQNLKTVLGERKPDYLVVHHVEPDHASSLQAFLDVYPGTTLVGNAKTFQMLENYFLLGDTPRQVVKEGDTLDLGAHKLTFVMAPMVHWPEVMMSYDAKDHTLFSADAFGQFGALDSAAEWNDDEARRYYLNIVGKYGTQVQAVLKKAAGLEIETICPLHGPMLTDSIAHVLEKYQLWSTYTPEDNGILIAYASLHGNTAAVCEKLADILDQRGCGDIMLADLARDDDAEALARAFQYGKIVLAASTYNAGVMPAMDDFLHHLKAKNWQKRTVALIENGSWAPMAAKTMRGELETLKDITILEPVVTLRGAPKKTDIPALEALADALVNA